MPSCSIEVSKSNPVCFHTPTCREVVQELVDEYLASTRPDYISRGSPVSGLHHDDVIDNDTSVVLYSQADGAAKP